MNDWRDRVSVDPAVCHGQPCVRGTRVMAAVILDNLSAGVSREAIVRGYPPVTDADINAVPAYAAELARERVVPLPLETVK